MTSPVQRPILWAIAGSDSGGGAGIQADLLTAHGFGVHACTVITAVTAQSTRELDHIEAVPPHAVHAQLSCLARDLPPRAIKLGMLASAETIDIVARHLADLDAPLICDPVFRSGSGRPLLDKPALDRFRSALLPRVDLLTPNLPEAEALVGESLTTDGSIEQAAEHIRGLGTRSVLIKGGHREGTYAQDYFAGDAGGWWMTAPRYPAAGSHGSGCVTASAIAAAMASGSTREEALVWAKAFVTRGLRKSIALGGGNGPLAFGRLPDRPEDMPWITPTASGGRSRRRFRRMANHPIGLYPIVDSLEWVRRVLPHKPAWLQLRIKGACNRDVEIQIRDAIELARRSPTTLIINDHWEAAIRYGADAVHLGQDDLDPAALDALEQAGCGLGVSTHTIAEIARAIGEQPSYLALGTLFQTTSKVLDHKPLGLPMFRRLRALVDVPLVAIGGIHIEQGEEIADAGADGVAVISEVRDAPDLGDVFAAWQIPYPPGTAAATYGVSEG